MQSLLSLPLLCLLLTTCTAPAPAPEKEASTKQPNIVVILADDMGFSDIGCYGGEIATPNLDRLSAAGRNYRNFYNTGRCCPTRASLLTGQYAHTVGMGRMVTSPDRPRSAGPYQGYLSKDVPTIAERLIKAGYGTYMSGKWHVGEAAEHWPRRRGFDRYFGLISGASSYWTIRRDQKRHREMVHEDSPWEPPTDGSFYATHAYSDTAVSYVAGHDFAEQPLFLYLAYTAPHWPLHAPAATTAKYRDRYRAGWDSLRTQRLQRMSTLGTIPATTQPAPMDADIPRWADYDNQDSMALRMAIYAAMVEEMDQGIGKLLQQLTARGQLDNTLIFFLSDNGGCAENITARGLNQPESTPGQPGSYLAYDRPWSQLSNVPFRRYKQWMHEGGIATPLIMHWPAGGVAPGWWDTPGHVIDLLPTCLAATGLPDDALPGHNQLADYGTNRPLFWEHFGKAAVRRKGYKIVRNGADAPWQLYNLHNDPTELQDLAKSEPELLDSLAVLWQDWAEDVGVFDLK